MDSFHLVGDYPRQLRLSLRRFFLKIVYGFAPRASPMLAIIVDVRACEPLCVLLVYSCSNCDGVNTGSIDRSIDPLLAPNHMSPESMDGSSASPSFVDVCVFCTTRLSVSGRTRRRQQPAPLGTPEHEHGRHGRGRRAGESKEISEIVGGAWHKPGLQKPYVPARPVGWCLRRTGLRLTSQDISFFSPDLSPYFAADTAVSVEVKSRNI